MNALRASDPTAVLDRAGASIAYQDVGAGPLVVLLHGGALDRRMWRPQIEALATDHRVVAVDARGHGASSTPTVPFRPCDDVAGLIAHLGTGPAVLVGLSMGAGVALDTALEHPERVRALVISGAGTSEPDFEDPWTVGLLADWAGTGERQDAAGWLEVFLRLGVGPHRDAEDLDPGVMAQLRAMGEHTLAAHLRPDPDTGRIRAPQLIPVPDTWARLPQITVPLLAVLGGADSDDHIRMAERAAAAVADGRTVTVGGTAHYPNLERPDRFTAHVRGFLDRLPQAGSTPNR